MTNYLLTIIIPMYNVETYIGECLESILKNDVLALKQVELILVDDKSPDNSKMIAEKFIKKSILNARIISHEENLGLGGARNTGIKAANGKFITFIDSDDWYAELSIEKIIAHLTKNPEVDTFVFGFKAIKNGNITWSYLPDKSKHIISGKEGLEDLSLDKITPAAWNKIFNAEVLKNIKFPLHRYYEDLEYTPQAFQNSKDILFLNESYLFYRQDGNSITRQDTKPKHIEDISDVLYTLNEKIIDKSIFSNFFFNRWEYLLKSWSLNKHLFSLAIERIDSFICEHQQSLNFKSPLAKSFFNRLITEAVQLNNLREVNKILNNLFSVVYPISSHLTPLISIIVPVFNAENFISKFTASFTTQNPNLFEIIFVEDCSDDNSLNLLLNQKDNFNNISIIQTLSNFGAGVARNIGLRHAKGDYVIFHDIDDIPDENLLEIAASTIKENNDPDLIIHPFSVLNSDYSYAWSSVKIQNLNKKNYTGSEIFELISDSVINPAPWNKVFKRSIWLENNIQFDPWIHHQDLSTIPYACFKCKNVIILDQKLYSYYLNKKGVTQGVSDKHVSSVFYALTSLYERFNKNENEIDEFLKEQFLNLSFENIAYNFKLRKDLFSHSQLNSFIQHYIDFIKVTDVSLTYLLGSKEAFTITKTIINSSIENGITPKVGYKIDEVEFENLILFQQNIDNQIELLLNEINTDEVSNSNDVNQIYLKKEKEYLSIIQQQKFELKEKQNSINWYARTYEHLPKWFLKIGGIFRYLK
ncbi:glycosyltransferase [Brumimicrobium aurantiacum]|uniref:Glycosyltransferase n=1 Tax=Brumimicrobium aurantiacum TaxID=1737063 RepID=A0A3E1F2L9_9FLAO|nr:glycosyltransferase [Brumimicrobium aurantiacum]RFC55957.1 glycosyltransferase [Brumimicrobium aurantiacum]